MGNQQKRNIDSLRKIARVGIFMMLMFIGVHPQAWAQKTSAAILVELNTEIDHHQTRIDKFDKKEDLKVLLTGEERTAEATKTYLFLPDQIQLNVRMDQVENDIQKAKMLRKLIELMTGITEENYLRYNGYSRFFEAIVKVQTEGQTELLMPYMSNHLEEMLRVVPFFENRKVAPLFFKEAAERAPRLLMQAYKEFEYQTYAKDILARAIHLDPDYVKNYLGTYSSLYFYVKSSSLPIVKTIKDIFIAKGSASNAFVLSHAIAAGKISINKAHDLAIDDAAFFKYLLQYRITGDAAGLFSIDHAMEHLALKWVRKFNELHDETRQEVRFAAATGKSSEVLYAMMVYTEDEIFTSTFLGLFKQMMKQNGKMSAYEFLNGVQWIHFRDFLKMCAGYGVLPELLGSMTELERKMLLTKLLNGIENDPELIRQCAAIADIYASLPDSKDKKNLNASMQHIVGNLNIAGKNIPALQLLYELIQAEEDTSIKSWSDEYHSLSNNLFFRDGWCIQQHFFYNDPDGISSFQSFIASFNTKFWLVESFKLYVKISSKTGKKVVLYANRPESEYVGQDAIRAIFVKTGMWPDIVVHRGHSFYVQTSLESVMPGTQLVFLGSCGGYQNVRQALQFASNAFIISTRQVGSARINDELLYTMNEWIRTGRNLNWTILWNLMDTKLSTNTKMKTRFTEYVAPNQNLGALYLRRYNQLY
jgi:hypothetical protein